MSEDWLKIIKDRLESYESPVPDGVWETVEASVFPEKAHKVRFMPWVWAVSAAAAIALGVFFGVRLVDRGGDGSPIIENNRLAEGPASPDIDSSSSANDGGGQVPSVKQPVTIIPAPKGSALALADEVVIPTGTGETLVEPDVEEIEVEQEEIKVEQEEVKIDQDVKKDTGFKTDHDGEDWSRHLSATDDDSRGQRGKPSAGLSLSSAASHTQDITTVDTRTFFQGISANMDPGTRNDASIYSRTVQVPVTKDEEHRRPVRLPLSIDFPLNDVLSLESGITYSILQSTYTMSSGSRVSKETQSLGYLGIPLKLKGNLWDNDLLTFYASGGGMVEKCVRGLAKTQVSVSGDSQGTSSKRSFDVKPLVWSLNASAGLQINLPGSFGIYAEPGVSYHFADNTVVKSIYTEHPFDFVLTFGARFSFR